jgi:preprotein translocase subunit SecD
MRFIFLLSSLVLILLWSANLLAERKHSVEVRVVEAGPLVAAKLEIESATVSGREVRVRVAPLSAAALEEATALTVGRHLAFVVDGKTVGALLVRDAIHGGQASLTLESHAAAVRVQKALTGRN